MMIVLANLLSKSVYEYRYAFGPDAQHLDGILYLNINDMQKCGIEKSCKGLHDNWGLRILAKIWGIVTRENRVPELVEYCPGY